MNITDIYDRSYQFALAVGAKGGPPLRIVVSLDESCADDPVAQLIATAVCNLLPRISVRYTLVDIEVPETAQLVLPRQPKGSLLQHLLNTLKACTVNGKYSVSDASCNYDICLVVGNQSRVLPTTSYSCGPRDGGVLYHRTQV